MNMEKSLNAALARRHCGVGPTSARLERTYWKQMPGPLRRQKPDASRRPGTACRAWRGAASLALWVALLTSGGMAHAHEFWLAARPPWAAAGDTVEVRAFVGTGFRI